MKLNRWKKLFTVFLFVAVAAIASPAQTFATLLAFDGTDGGYVPSGLLVQGFDGNLYGTTEVGGANQLGTIFKIARDGTLTTLYNF